MLDGDASDQHIQRRLGRAIAVPPAKVVVANAANPRR